MNQSVKEHQASSNRRTVLIELPAKSYSLETLLPGEPDFSVKLGDFKPKKIVILPPGPLGSLLAFTAFVLLVFLLIEILASHFDVVLAFAMVFGFFLSALAIYVALERSSVRYALMARLTSGKESSELLHDSERLVLDPRAEMMISNFADGLSKDPVHIAVKNSSGNQTASVKLIRRGDREVYLCRRARPVKV